MSWIMEDRAREVWSNLARRARQVLGRGGGGKVACCASLSGEGRGHFVLLASLNDLLLLCLQSGHLGLERRDLFGHLGRRALLLSKLALGGLQLLMECVFFLLELREGLILTLLGGSLERGVQFGLETVLGLFE